MDNRIFPEFNDGFDYEEDYCSICDLVDAFLPQITNVRTHEELRHLLHGIIDGSFKDGYMTALQDDIEIKSDSLNKLYKDF